MGLNVDFGCIHTVPNYHPKIQIPQKKLTLMCFYIPAMFGGAA